MSVLITKILPKNKTPLILTSQDEEDARRFHSNFWNPEKVKKKSHHHITTAAPNCISIIT